MTPTDVDGGVERALGDEHVLPEVAEAARDASIGGERRVALVDPSANESDGVLDLRDAETLDRAAVGEGAPRRARPTSAARGRGRDDADRTTPHPRARSASPRRDPAE